MLTDLGLAPGTLVVCPSLSFPVSELRKITAVGHYEERLLFYLAALDDPSLSVVYLSSARIEPAVIDYYLSFVQDPSDARRRLTLVSLDSSDLLPLCQKLMGDGAAIERLRSVLTDHGWLLPFNVTGCEASLARALGLSLVGPPPELAFLGSKSGARKVARAAGIAVPEGAEDLRSEDDVERALEALLERRPEASRVVIKLNKGFSGQGNAIVTLRGPRLRDATTVFCSAQESWTSFAAKIGAQGCVVEELLSAPDLASPSVQLWIHPEGKVQVLSTHDQILGGPDDQVYLGCRFPARQEYRGSIVRAAKAIGEELAVRGVIGPFGVDFLVPAGRPDGVLMSEINLRMGGTTHPFGMVRLVTRGRYDAVEGELRVEGTAKSYVATDNLRSKSYVGLRPTDAIDEVRDRGLAFDPRRATGVMLHLLGALPGAGKLGATCVGNSRDECDDLYARLVSAMDSVAEARGGAPLPRRERARPSRPTPPA